MHATLPEISNREDLVLTLSVSDDDLGVGINTTGITLANPGAPFIASAWTVTDGAIATTSSTPITIPAFPVGNQVTNLALTVAARLAIKPQDPIRIVDTATGLNMMIGYVVSYAFSTGALICQIGFTYQFEIRAIERSMLNWTGYPPYYDLGTVDGLAPMITATLGGGPNQGTILTIDTGFLQVMVPEMLIRGLAGPRTLGCFMTATDSVNTRQFFLGRLPVVYGGVTN
jgi:hypothetical protein